MAWEVVPIEFSFLIWSDLLLRVLYFQALIGLVFSESYKIGHHPPELLSSLFLPFHKFCQSDSQFLQSETGELSGPVPHPLLPPPPTAFLATFNCNIYFWFLLIMNSWCSSKETHSSLFSCCQSLICVFSRDSRMWGLYLDMSFIWALSSWYWSRSAVPASRFTVVRHHWLSHQWLSGHIVLLQRLIRVCQDLFPILTAFQVHSSVALSTFPLVYNHHAPSVSRTFSSYKTLYPLNTNFTFFLLPAPGNHYSTVCLYEFDYSGNLVWVESHSICPFDSGLLHLA